MKLHGTQRSLQAGVVRVGFWEEVALVLNCPCYGRGSTLHKPTGFSPPYPPRPERQISSFSDEETEDPLPKVMQHPSMPEPVLKFPHSRRPTPQSCQTRMAGHPILVTGQGFEPKAG